MLNKDDTQLIARFIEDGTKPLLERIEKLEAAQSQKSKPPEPTVWPAKGDLMIFLGKNGYERELTEALRIFKVGQQYRVLECNVQSWSHSVRFEDVAGWYNGVMFERVTDTRPLRALGENK